jgi:hypothetical protein
MMEELANFQINMILMSTYLVLKFVGMADNCVWDELVKESQDIWINGIIGKEIKYRVAKSREL